MLYGSRKWEKRARPPPAFLIHGPALETRRFLPSFLLLLRWLRRKKSKHRASASTKGRTEAIRRRGALSWPPWNEIWGGRMCIRGFPFVPSRENGDKKRLIPLIGKPPSRFWGNRCPYVPFIRVKFYGSSEKLLATLFRGILLKVTLGGWRRPFDRRNLNLPPRERTIDFAFFLSLSLSLP